MGHLWVRCRADRCPSIWYRPPHERDQAEEARFWQGVKDHYARLQDDPEQWSGYVNELAEWDQTVGDGLDDLE
jgi:hypothetical protein